MSSPIDATLIDFWGNAWPLGYWAPGPRRRGIRLKSITGLAGAPYAFDEIQGATTDGVIVRSRKDEANVIGMVCYVDFPGGGDDAVDYLMAWRRALGRGLARTTDTPPLRLTIHNSGRWQDVRFLAAKSEPEYQRMGSVGRAAEELTFRQDLSWWIDDPAEESFTAAEFAGASIANDGDVDTWPTYRLTGPITSPRLGLDGELSAAGVLPSLSAGQWLDIDTDPDTWSIVDQAGVDRSWVGVRWLKKAPAGHTTTVSITGSGTTTATKLDVTLPQYYWAAF